MGAALVGDLIKDSSGKPVVIDLPQRPTEQERAGELKALVSEEMRAVLDLMDQAAREGFKVQWNIGLDMYGRHQLVDLHLIKRF